MDFLDSSSELSPNGRSSETIIVVCAALRSTGAEYAGIEVGVVVIELGTTAEELQTLFSNFVGYGTAC